MLASPNWASSTRMCSASTGPRVYAAGWAQDAVPTLKGGSTIGIPSPPAVWHRLGEAGRRIVTPNITEAERLQGFDAMDSASGVGLQSQGNAWKLVGNAVTVGVAEWVGSRLRSPDRGSLR